MTDRELWLGIRQALLMALDVMERWLGIAPTTAEIRKASKHGIG